MAIAAIIANQQASLVLRQRRRPCADISNSGSGLLYPRARLVENIARANRWLLAELLAHEQEPWLAAQMKYELTSR